MDYDLATLWMLWLFGACFAALLLGAVVARLSTFESGLATGLLLLGGVSLSFVPRFWLEHRDLTRHPLRAEGVVVAVEDRAANAAGDVTTPVAVVEYAAPGGGTRRADSKAASGFEVGEKVVVVPRPAGPLVGQPGQSRGGIVAALMFGTFPFSAGLFFVVTALADRRDRRAGDAARRRTAARMAARSRLAPGASLVAFAGFVAPLAWVSLRDGLSLLHALLLAFGGLSLGLWLHVLDGLRLRRDPRWTAGIAVIALNLSLWALVLWPYGAAAPGEAW